MNRNLVKQMGVVLLAGAAMVVVLSACGGSAGANTLSTAATATLGPTSVSTATPTLAPARTQSAVPAPTPTVNNGSGDLLAQGKLIFESAAGGVGCAACHGLDGKGKSAPYNRGTPEWKVREVLTSSATMSFIKLSDEEIKAVVAYLQYLATQP